VAKIKVQQTEITVIQVKDEDYISLTDIAKYKSDDPAAVIGNWLRNRNTIEYLGLWEILYNPGFKPLEFSAFHIFQARVFQQNFCSAAHWGLRGCRNEGRGGCRRRVWQSPYRQCGRVFFYRLFIGVYSRSTQEHLTPIIVNRSL
jgi:hypothetical protein